MRHCTDCGARLSLATPDGDNRERHVCGSCGRIHYQNPKLVCGCVVAWRRRVLLCRRAIAPRYGRWTLPAGFMENGEGTEQAALRETREEACAEVIEPALFGIYSMPRIAQVYVMFRGMLGAADGFAAGTESLDVRLFAAAEIPWDELAFPVVTRTLKRYLAEQESGRFSVAVEDLI